MTVRRLEENGDITTSGTQFSTGKNEIAQTIETRLKLFAGEYFRDISIGTPWFDRILGKSGALDESDAIIRTTIAQTEGVKTLASYNADYDINTRIYSITGSVLTAEGVQEINIGVSVDG